MNIFYILLMEIYPFFNLHFLYIYLNQYLPLHKNLFLLFLFILILLKDITKIHPYLNNLDNNHILKEYVIQNYYLLMNM